MAEVFEQNKKKYWKNAEGDLIPVSRIFPHEKKSDRLVESLHKRIGNLQEKIKAEKAAIAKSVNDYLAVVAADHNEEWEGGTTLFNFDKSKQVEVRLSKHYVTDERMGIAETKIKNLIRKWAPGSNDNLIALVEIAFELDKQGKYNVDKIIELRKVKIKDKEWKEAMDLAFDSISTDYTKTYFNFRKKNADGKLVPIPLNFSAL